MVSTTKPQNEIRRLMMAGKIMRAILAAGYLVQDGDSEKEARFRG